MTALLRLKVDDKLYRPITHYRDTILQLADYFDRHRRVLPSVLGPTGAALPGLYAGRVFAELGDAPQALDYYQRALDAQPTGQGGSRRLLKQRGLLHSLIGETFFFQGLYREAVASLQDANRWAVLAKDTSDIIFNLRDMAEQFISMNMADSSLAYYRKALKFSTKIGDARMTNELKSQIAAVYCELGRYGEAKMMIQPSLRDVDSASITSIYNIASKVYMHEGNLDSAIVCFNKLLQFGNLYGRCNAHRELSDMALKTGDLNAASSHFRQYKTLSDSIQTLDNAETVARMHAAYNYRKHEAKALRLKVANEQKRNVIIILLLSITVLALVSHLLYKRYQERKHKAQKLETEKEKLAKENRELADERTELRSEIQRLEQKNAHFVDGIGRDLKNVRELITRTNKGDSDALSVLYREKRRLDHANNLIAATQSQKDDHDLQLQQSDIYNNIQQKIVEKDFKLSVDEWQQLEDVLNSLYGDFVERLKAFVPITEDELHMSMLLKIRLQHKFVAAFLYKTPSAEANARKRLYDRVFKTEDSSASEWDAFILDF